MNTANHQTMRCGLVSAILILVASAAPADIHYVSTNGLHQTPFASWVAAATNIQAAVNAARNGDGVLVTNGTYVLASAVRVTNALTVQSVNGASCTFVDGNMTTRCFIVTSTGAVVEGFSMVRGRTIAGDRGGGGLYISGGVVRSCIISNNRAMVSGHGGGVYVVGGGLVTNCVIAYNGAGISGRNAGGVYVGSGGKMTDCIITNNMSQFLGGGVFIDTGGTVECCRIVANEATLGGGGVYANTNGVLRRCSIDRNEADNGNGWGGGVFCMQGARVESCVIGNNSALYGAGLFATGLVVISDCTIVSNQAMGSTGGYGGGGFLMDGVRMERCSIRGNHARYEGGGLSCRGSVAVSDCAIISNSAGIVTIGNGGGAYFEGDGRLSNCAVMFNSANHYGGGVDGGTLQNCMLHGNSAPSGGGAFQSALNNCTLSGNSADYGGGAYQGTLNNCIVYYNTGLNGPNYYEGSFAFCCTTPYPGGAGNMASIPHLLTPSHIAPLSPCVGAGNAAYGSGADLGGDPWRTPPSMGCDEPTRPATGALAVVIRALATNIARQCSVPFLQADIQGTPVSNGWFFGDGQTLVNQSFEVGHAWEATGFYTVTVIAWNDSHPEGVSATVQVQVVTNLYYVSESNLTAAVPYDSWATAAATVQDALDVAPFGALVLVSNGTYNTGGRIRPGLYRGTNRVVVPEAVSVRSVNGPDVTIIAGNIDELTPGGDNAVRCVYLSDGAGLAGFTVTQGGTRHWGNDTSGGGIYGANGIVSNCIITGNFAEDDGGGAYWGTLYNCTITGNSAFQGGGVSDSTLYDCTLSGNTASYGGGGAARGRLYNCILSNNAAASGSGGGMHYGRLYNCLIVDNRANDGGGVSSGVSYNSTVTGNRADDQGGGAYWGTFYNCIVYDNSALTNGANYFDSTMHTCCSDPLPEGSNNIAGRPLFADQGLGDYRLKPASPCINVGLNQDWMFDVMDLDGHPRIIQGVADMGAYEFHFDMELKAFLQGPYNANLHAMTQTLSSRIPPISPYAGAPNIVAAIPSNATDWVLVQVRPGLTNAPVFIRSGVLRNDGRMLSDSGSTQWLVEVSPGTTNYLVISHRNHLSAMSALPIVFTNQMLGYDFSTGSGKFNGGTNAAVQLEPGVWGMIAGDADGDGKITATDRVIVERQAGMSGYVSGDLDLNGVVDE